MSIFEKIAAKELPGNIIYQDDSVFVLIDIKPNRLGHSLIIPKRKKENLLQEDDATISAIYKVAKKIAPAYQKVLGAKGFKLNTNINKEADQVVFHTHVHFIPYYENYNDFKDEMIDQTMISLLKEEIDKL